MLDAAHQDAEEIRAMAQQEAKTLLADAARAPELTDATRSRDSVVA
jgi:hypothetical protein